jgi:hypothetical protein
VVDLNGQLRLHKECRIALERIGNEASPVLVVDNFLGNPQILIEYAAANSALKNESETFYPGVRAPIPAIYCFALRAFLGGAIGEAFGLQSADVTGELSHFSLVTTRLADLNALQRIPHFDNTNPKQLAVLHYLCGPGFGGTSFYRHRRTGFECVDPARRGRYTRMLAEELNASPPASPGYICGDDAMFARTASFAADFNRVLIYRSINLHSADIGPRFSFDENPRTGRLTANSFFYYR